VPAAPGFERAVVFSLGRSELGTDLIERHDRDGRGLDDANRLAGPSLAQNA